MTNLTISMDERVLERARSMASEQGTSLEALVRNFVESFASREENREQAVKTLLDLSWETKGGSGGRRWRSRRGAVPTPLPPAQLPGGPFPRGLAHGPEYMESPEFRKRYRVLMLLGRGWRLKAERKGFVEALLPSEQPLLEDERPFLHV